MTDKLFTRYTLHLRCSRRVCGCQNTNSKAPIMFEIIVQCVAYEQRKVVRGGVRYQLGRFPGLQVGYSPFRTFDTPI